MSFDYSRLRGTNYVVSTTLARDHFQAMLSPNSAGVAASGRARYPSGCFMPFGQFDPCVVRAELEHISKQGCQNIRVYTPFTAWLISPDDFLSNLRFLLDTCDCFGMTFTCIVWTSSTAEGPFFVPTWQFANAISLSPSPQSPAVAFRFWGDFFHSYWIDPARRSSGVMPPILNAPGTFFLMAPWSDPDNALRYLGVITAGTGLTNWNGIYSGLDAFAARLRRPGFPRILGLGDAINVFLTEIARLFRDHAAFLSYDLFNEPTLAEITLTASQLASIADIIAATYRVLADEHVRGRPRAFPDATIGMSDFPDDVNRQARLNIAINLYGAVDNRLANLYPRTPPRLAYVSYHDNFSADLARTATYLGMGPIAQLRTRLGLDCVVSEFFAQFSPLTSPDLRGKLRNLLLLMERNGVGGQIWSILETNFMNPGINTRNGRPTGNAFPSEGLFRPLDPDRVAADCARLAGPIRFSYLDYAGRINDLAALRNWFLGTPAMRRFCPPAPVVCP